MKKLVLVTGPVGVGKTSVCEQVFKSLDDCAWLDADWCWMVNPWRAKTPNQKTCAEDLFARILRGYLVDPNIHIALFSWVMHAAWMFDLVSSPLSDIDLEIYRIALVCDQAQHVDRMRNDDRRDEQISATDSSEEFYNLGAKVIDTTGQSITETAESAIRIIQGNSSEG